MPGGFLVGQVEWPSVGVILLAAAAFAGGSAEVEEAVS